jgi:hypothetical protein
MHWSYIEDIKGFLGIMNVVRMQSIESIHITIRPTGTTDSQKMAVLLVRFVPVDMSTIKTGKTYKQRTLKGGR